MEPLDRRIFSGDNRANDIWRRVWWARAPDRTFYIVEPADTPNQFYITHDVTSRTYAVAGPFDSPEIAASVYILRSYHRDL